MLELKSFLQNEWQRGAGDGTPLYDPSTGEVVASATTEGLDLGAALAFARREVRPRLPAVQLSMLWDLTRIGAPIASANFLFCLIYILLTPIIAKQGSAAVAAIGVGHRIGRVTTSGRERHRYIGTCRFCCFLDAYIARQNDHISDRGSDLSCDRFKHRQHFG